MPDGVSEALTEWAGAGNRIRLPSVDQVLRSETGLVAVARYGHNTAVKAIRQALAQFREQTRNGIAATPDATAVAAAALRLAEEKDAASVRSVFNLTGTVLHTNLGRAVLPEAAIQAAVEAMRNPVALEFDIGGGERGDGHGNVG